MLSRQGYAFAAGARILFGAVALALVASLFVPDRRPGEVEEVDQRQGDDAEPLPGRRPGPAIESDGIGEFLEANGGILREVDLTDFPRRSRLLADEIKKKEPELVGLQEVALWRSAQPCVTPAL